MFKWVDRLERNILCNISVFLFCISGIVMIAESAIRTLAGSSLQWSDEVARYTMIWAILLVMARAGREEHHIRIDLVLHYMPAGFRRASSIIANVLSLIFSLIFTVASVNMVAHAYKMKQMSASTLQLPMWAVLIIMPISGVLLCLYYLENLLRKQSVSREEGGEA